MPKNVVAAVTANSNKNNKNSNACRAACKGTSESQTRHDVATAAATGVTTPRTTIATSNENPYFQEVYQMSHDWLASHHWTSWDEPNTKQPKNPDHV